MFYEKKLKMMSLIILLIGIYLIGSIKVGALTVRTFEYKVIEGTTGNTFIYNDINSSFDVYGTIKNNSDDYSSFSTTYDDDGYFTFLKVGNNDEKLVDKYNADAEIDGINVNISLSKDSNTNSINVKYTLTNTSDEIQSVKLGTTADNKLSYNDQAAIYKEGHSKIVVTQDNNPTDCGSYECQVYKNSYGIQIVMDFSPEVTTSWIGDWYSGFWENIFTDGNVTSYTVDDEVDSVFAYSWSDTFEPGESKTYTAKFTAREAEKSTVRFYKYEENDPIIKEVLLGGSVKTETVHEEDNYIYEWNTKQDGTGNYYPANRSILVTVKDMTLYELKYDKNHNIVLESNENVTITTENDSVVEHHGTLKYNLTPKEGYKIVSVMVNDVEKVSELKENVLTIENVMGNVNIDVKAVPDYKLTEGANQKYVVNKDNQLKFKANVSYDLFASGGKIYVDNVLVDEENYSYENSDGKVLFTLNKKYLDTLSTGNYDIKFVFSDEGEAVTTFSVENYINNPKTGDNIIFYGAIGALSILGLVEIGIHIIRRRQKNMS